MSIVYYLIIALMTSSIIHSSNSPIGQNMVKEHTNTKQDIRASAPFDSIVIEANSIIPTDIKLIILPNQSQNSITVEGSNNLATTYSTYVENNILYIEPKNKKGVLDSITGFFSSNTTPAALLTLTVGLANRSDITITGPAQINIDGITGDNFTLTATGALSINGSANVDKQCTINKTGSGTVTFTIHAHTLQLASSGAGRFDIEGDVKDQDVRISGSGVYNASRLTSKNTTITLNGAVQAEINATDTINAAASGSSHITHHGSAKKVTSMLRGVATIEKAQP